MMNCIFILFFFFQRISLGFGDIIAVPPFNISRESFLKYLSIESGNLDFPALYVFGDSFVDAGNNKYFPKIPQIQSNYSPYGIDFGGVPTGRYSNGRLVTDFIAQFGGLPYPPPALSYSNSTDKKIPQTGLSYAVTFTGIGDGKEDFFGKFEEAMPKLKDQVKLFEKTTKQLQSQFENKESFVKYLSKSLFFINAITYDLDDDKWPAASIVYDKYSYTQLLVNELSKQLQILYRLGARKIVVNNAFPIEYEPHRNYTGNGYVNELAVLFNQRLSFLIKDLRSILSESLIVLVDLHKIFEDVFESPASYGFTTINAPCCSKLHTDVTERCVANVAVCKDRSKYIFFDTFNPTESMHFIWASRSLSDSSVSFPINLIQLIQASF